MNYFRDLRFRFLDDIEAIKKRKKKLLKMPGIFANDFLEFYYSLKITFLLLEVLVVTLPFYIFYSPNRSFWLIYKRAPNGIYRISYTKHIFNQKIIIASLIGLIILFLFLIFW